MFVMAVSKFVIGCLFIVRKISVFIGGMIINVVLEEMWLKKVINSII